MYIVNVTGSEQMFVQCQELSDYDTIILKVRPLHNYKCAMSNTS